jgi:nitrite reductase/ring-hydroxylating ferredoxin subunit
MEEAMTLPEATGSSKLAYTGYAKAVRPADDTLLTAIGPRTPCGEYMRRFWQPFLIASELKQSPIAVRLLGEDLVVFRDKSGTLGLLQKHCIHRGASLEFGIPAERGIICCYHGWHFDVDGSVLATPAEPATSLIRQNCSQGAYPVREEAGLLFAYLGPIDEMPEFPIYDTFVHPSENKLAPFLIEAPCNWLQIVENAADPIHNAYLHAIVAGEQFSSAFKASPELDFPETPIGFLSMATRYVDGRLFVRASDMIMPNIGQFPNGSNDLGIDSASLRPYITRWVVPIDDTHSIYIGVAHLNEYNARSMSQDPEMYGRNLFPFIGQTADRPYAERQLEPGDYDAVVGQGGVANRKAEHLGTTDKGVVTLRRRLTQAIKDLQAGQRVQPYARDKEGRVRTYAHETVLKLRGETAPAGSDVRKYGQSSVEAFIETDQLPLDQREVEAERKIRSAIDVAG